MVQTDGRAGGQAYGHVIIKFFRMGRLLHFLPMVLRCASFARKSSAIIQRHSNFGSTTQYNMNRKTFRFILAVSAEHRTYNNTLYNIFYCIQIRGGKTRTELSDSLLRILSEQRPEKNLPEKNLSRIYGSCSENPILRRLHGWKVFAFIYKTSIPTKDDKL